MRAGIVPPASGIPHIWSLLKSLYIAKFRKALLAIRVVDQSIKVFDAENVRALLCPETSSLVVFGMPPGDGGEIVADEVIGIDFQQRNVFWS